VSLRIAFDLDGVLADMDSALSEQAKTLFGETAVRPPAAMASDGADADSVDEEPEPDASPPIVRLNLTPRQQRRLWQHVRQIDNFWQSLNEIEPGTVARIAQLAEQQRWEVIFVTKRPQTEGATAQVQSQRWLESRGFPLPSVYVVQGSRGRIATALSLDIVVDDRPENCLDVVVDSQAKPILIWRDRREALPAAAQRLGISVVSTVAECLNTLAKADTQPSNESMFQRLKRLFGPKERKDA
jgi:beta-phosphoglucomutase-like phosphatase (HAD superfamily)